MLRVRFYTHEKDYRPVKWPVKHPYWCSGHGEDADGEYNVIVSYADNYDYIYTNWPEAYAVDVMQDNEKAYTFTDRFPKPEWFKEGEK